ncbi:uncharacterized protein LOC117164528 isoform X1 [Bombus vancouverensis nearcticus]|uniref:uncharacterized protein LOC117164528 isoform X1 n=1 Tax=Bombus vancouverensis nearcticus TaxID=2705178 RepID=UPI00402BA65D
MKLVETSCSRDSFKNAFQKIPAEVLAGKLGWVVSKWSIYRSAPTFTNTSAHLSRIYTQHEGRGAHFLSLSCLSSAGFTFLRFGYCKITVTISVHHAWTSALAGCWETRTKSGSRGSAMDRASGRREISFRFQKACVKYGVPDVDLFQAVDLMERKNIAQVTNTIFAIGRTTYRHPEWRGPWLGPRPAEENKRNFTEEQLRAGEGYIGLQAGTNKGATQAGQNFGATRKILLGK